MSGARKKTVCSGNFRANIRTQLAHVRSAWRVPLSSGKCDSPSAAEMSDPVAERQVDAAVRDADVVEHRLDLAPRGCPAGPLLELANLRSVSSIRVPGDAAHVET